MSPDKIIYRVVRIREYPEEALSLIYKRYLRRGYIPK